VAERFELLIDGLEIANGFHELRDAGEQARRFEEDNRIRRSRGLMEIPVDQYLIAALAHGLPDCAGVALGLDRLLMSLSGKGLLSEIMTFSHQRS
jgi:lysyl-tRNA synthetase class 2